MYKRQVGSTVVVTKITGDGAYKRRIMDMGITKGSELYIRKVAPLGDPVEITVRGYELSVRKNDAQCVDCLLYTSEKTAESEKIYSELERYKEKYDKNRFN